MSRRQKKALGLADQGAPQETKVDTTPSTPVQSDAEDEDETASVGNKPKPTAMTSSSLFDALESTSLPSTTTTTSTASTGSFSSSSSLPSFSSSNSSFAVPDNGFAKMFKPTESISSSVLADIPNVYLYDRSNWTEFKKILNECGGTWNFPHWMTTIVRDGEEWKLMQSAGHPVDQVFPIGKVGMEEKSSDLASKMIASLGLPTLAKTFAMTCSTVAYRRLSSKIQGAYLRGKKCGHGSLNPSKAQGHLLAPTII